jgi:multiple sugar transport system substrate-binding protein
MVAKALCAFIVAGILAGCGGAAPVVSDGGEPAGGVRFMVFGDPAEKAAYETLVAAFEERRPAIDVELQHIPSQADYRQRIGADFAAGTPADVVLINYRRYAPFAARGALEPLGPYLDRSELISPEAFYAESLGPFTWEGTLICIPQNLSSLVVYYNKDLFDQAGLPYPRDSWTWDEFLATAQALTRDTDGDGASDQYGLGTTAEAIRVAPFIWQNGGALVDDEASPTRLALDTPEATAAFQWFVDLQVRHRVVPDAAAEEAEDSESRFLNGRTAMLLNSRRGVPTYREIEGFDWDVAPLPRGVQAATVLHADAYCLPAVSENKPAAWAFIEFANSSEGQAIIARTGRTVPSLKAVAESEAFLDPQAKPLRSKVFLDVIPQTRAVPVMATWPEIEEALTNELQRAYYGQASVEEAIATAIEQTERYFGAP